MAMHAKMAAALDKAFDIIQEIQQTARQGSAPQDVSYWPLILLHSPKEVDGKKTEGFWRAHQVPVAGCRDDDGYRQILA